MKTRPGRPPKHGAYNLLQDLARGTLDKRSREAKALRRVTRDLVASLGASSLGELDARQRILVQQAATLAVVTSLMTARAFADGVVDSKGRVNPILRERWLAYHGKLTKVLDALGIAKGNGGAPNLGELLKNATEDERRT